MKYSKHLKKEIQDWEIDAPLGNLIENAEILAREAENKEYYEKLNQSEARDLAVFWYAALDKPECAQQLDELENLIEQTVESYWGPRSSVFPCRDLKKMVAIKESGIEMVLIDDQIYDAKRKDLQSE